MFYFIGLLVALFVGWATPQPAWAAAITNKIVAKFKELTVSDDIES
jgi:hypothetical protein